MTKKIAIGFLLLYSFSVTELNELLKVPFLISHFLDHKDQKLSVTFTDFIKEHYTHHSTNEQDQEHHQLPFKNHVDLVLFSTLIAIPHNHAFELQTVFSSDEPVLVAIHKSNYSFQFKNKKWQPPKV
ncbi:MAG: hypothetical protein IT239_00250 [Bacteroidia bacterium]|nr:hypothetical protein [Bacteroidia bacterium]